MAPKEDKKNVDPQPPARSKSSKLGAAEDEHDIDPDFLKHHKKFMAFVIVYNVLDNILMILAAVIFGYSIYAMVVIPKVSDHEKGRLAGLALLLIVQIVIAVVAYYATSGFVKGSLKKASSVVVLSLLGVVAVLELAGVGIAVFVGSQEQDFVQSLTKDFVQAKSNEPASLKFYHHLESSLKCCGLDGPTDYGVPAYNYAFPPDVSISCCPSFDHDLSDLEQNKARQTCKVNRSYYTQGCKGPAAQKLKNILHPLLGLLVASVFFVVSLLALGLVAKFCAKKILQPNQTKKQVP